MATAGSTAMVTSNEPGVDLVVHTDTPWLSETDAEDTRAAGQSAVGAHMLSNDDGWVEAGGPAARGPAPGEIDCCGNSPNDPDAMMEWCSATKIRVEVNWTLDPFHPEVEEVYQASKV